MSGALLKELARRVMRLERVLDDLVRPEMGRRVVWLETPLTSTSWDGDDTVAVGTTSVDTSAVFGAPAGIKAALIKVKARWGSANNGYTLGVRPQGGATNVVTVRAVVANFDDDAGGVVVPCDENGDLDLVVTNSNATNVKLEIWGYWL